MLGRRRIDTATPLRSSLANAAIAVEERVVWGGADAARRVFDVVKWPFERIVWAIERGLVWPLQERTGTWSGPAQTVGVAVLALLAAAAGVLGLVWASAGGGGNGSAIESAAPSATPVVRAVPTGETPPAAPVLQGPKPDFSAEVEGGASAGSAAATSAGSTATANSTSEVATSGATGSSDPSGAKVAGPAAIKVARQFSSAFVLYEIGKETARVRSVFAETATPQLKHSLLQRPPRQPAGVEVPKAKVLNVVAGPRHGDTYTLSVSLLRVGVTSELRLGVQQDPKTHAWHVTEALG